MIDPGEYVEYIMEQAQKLLVIDSPSDYGREIREYLLKECEALGITAWPTVKGGVLTDLGGRDPENTVLLEAHYDMLGAMVTRIKENGRLQLTNIGGMKPANEEAENIRIITKSNGIYEGTCQLVNASVHVNGEHEQTTRIWDTVEILIDEKVSSREEVAALGIMPGDYVCSGPRARAIASSYIKSHFLDDKFSATILMGYARYLKEESVTSERKVYVHPTIYEEVGHGGSSPVPEGVTGTWSVDMGCVGEELRCTEHQVSICAKDSGGPYNYEIVCRLIELTRGKGIGYAADVYPHYSSGMETILKAGHGIRHALTGPGVHASHGYERNHRDGVENTFRLIQTYLG